MNLHDEDDIRGTDVDPDSGAGGDGLDETGVGDGMQDLEPDAIKAIEDDSYDEEENKRGVSQDVFEKKLYKEREKRRSLKAELEEERQARLDAEKRLEGLQANSYDNEYKSLEKREESLDVELKKAFDDDDTEGFRRKNSELMDIKIRKREIEKAKSSNAPQRVEPARKNASGTVSAATQEWVENNADWFDEESDEFDHRKAKRARNIADALHKREGYDVDDPALYEELDRRLNGENGSRAPRTGYGDGSQVTVSGVGSTVPVTRTNPRRLSRADLAKMAEFNLDPKNTTHRKYWLKERAKRT